MIPNLSLAVVSGDGRLVLARGYTNCAAFPTPNEVFIAQPTSRYRIMSVTKPLTATAIMTLVDAGELGLGDKVGDLLEEDLAGTPYNQELHEMEVWQLLSHLSFSGFGDTNNGPALTEDDANIASKLVESLPVTQRDIVQYAAEFVDFSPMSTDCVFNASTGQAYPDKYLWKYSNFGYLLLGRIIEAKTGSYERYMRDHIFAPLGMNDMALAGARKRSDRAHDEVRYYYGGTPLTSPAACATSVLDESGSCVEIPYGGGFNIDNFQAFGGWIGHPIDLCAFGWDMHDGATSTLLREATIDTMMFNWGGMDCKSSRTQWGLGWSLNMQMTGGRGHRGSKEGSRALLYLFPPTRAFGGAQNVVLALAMNRHPDENIIAPSKKPNGGTAWSAFLTALLGTTTAPGVLDGITDWGGTDNLAELYEKPELNINIFIPPGDPRARIGLADEALLRSVMDPSRFESLRVPDYSGWYRWPFYNYGG